MTERGNRHESQANNIFHTAILENQQLWREQRRGISRVGEIDALSRKVERSLKTVFSDYIDQDYPRVLISLNLGYHSRAYEHPYTKSYMLYPKSIKKEDRASHRRGVIELTEWATDYATSYYFNSVGKNIATQKIGEKYKDRALRHGKIITPSANSSMAEIANTAQDIGANFDHAVLSALFKHDFLSLNELIARTDSLNSNTVDELAVRLGKEPVLKRPEFSKENDSRLQQIGKQGLISIRTHGWQSVPGIVEINLVHASLGPTIGASFSLAGDVKDGIFFGTLATMIGTYNYPGTTIHEAIHGYSLSQTHSGIMPIILE